MPGENCSTSKNKAGYRRLRFAVNIKREVTTVESGVEDDTQALSLECASSTLRLPVNVSPHWLASLMKALNE